MILSINRDYFLSINPMIFAMENYCVLFAVQIEFLNIFRRTSASKG
jgi:hypothetical protein